MKLIVVLLFAVFASFGLLAQSPEEQEYSKWMKTINATMGSLRTNIQEKKADETAKGAATLVDAFKKSEDFWKGRKKDDAAEWSKKAWTAASEVEAAAKAGDFDKAGTALRGVFPNCQACHTAYREGSRETGYKFKQ
jgi:cytochrome c556